MTADLQPVLRLWERRLGAVAPWREPDEQPAGQPDEQVDRAAAEGAATSAVATSDAAADNPAVLGVMAFPLPGAGVGSGRPLSPPAAVAYNAHLPFPAASTIKVYILQALLERIAAGAAELNDEVVLGASDQVSGSGVLKSLTPGRSYTLLDLATLMIIVSDNTATNLLIDFVGVEEINESMRLNGWLDSTLSGKLQLASPPPGGKRSPSHTSPANLADYFGRLWLGELLPPELTTVAKEIYRKQQYGELGRYLDYDGYSVEIGDAQWRIASKSGSIRGVRNDAGVLESTTTDTKADEAGSEVRAGQRETLGAPRAPLVMAVMTSGCPDTRFHQDNLGARVLGAVARELFHRLG